MIDDEPKVADGSLVKRTLCCDVSLAAPVISRHVAGIDVIAPVAESTASVEHHATVIVRRQMRKPVQFGVDWQLSHAARERAACRQPTVLVGEGYGWTTVMEVAHRQV